MSKTPSARRGRFDQILRSVKSQVFDESQEPENLTTESAQSVARRRLSSWAFTRTQSTVQRDEPVQSATEVENPPTTLVTEEESTKVVIESDKDTDPVEAKERTQSWSLWSRPSRQIDQQTDAILSEPVAQNVSELPKPKKQKTEPSTDRKSQVVPSFESLPRVSPRTYASSALNTLKSVTGYGASPVDHLVATRSPAKFKRVLIIGVHGFFPTKMIRPLIGEPTGTSARFAQAAENAILSWAQEKNINISTQKIALEKEGKIFDRVDFFFEVMQKWHDELANADFIYVCAHSQGTPVAMMLLSRLLEHGLIADNKKISVLGMAGINSGPFYGMDQSLFVRAYSSIENQSLLELFQFQNFESLQSRKYLESVRNLVAHGVKITFVGSVNDQLVPLYSAVACHLSHPNIYKAVYIDGNSNTPDFVTRILKLSCLLQNLGHRDHGVVAEMSYALAGPLTGGGHSRIYDSPDVYKLALDFALCTSDTGYCASQPVQFHQVDVSKVGSNPFTLPWCTRGLFFDVKKRLPHGTDEIDMVFKEFDDWDPESKVLKDVKYRLNGIKDKL
ncbi:hypothetical protein OGAPHI_001235 [Ogataea philodendri]|uniref:YMC020W-like alpha/beta hydrolase domain-containing protein n=1 Tax=Ogataea philodendri TaxID=1378263 RepID=A0A9P8PFQ9_9ASCO|nr:uncharacterized protein OGAPHI_001235 [Ogataea philodendri]KAH3670720.1 hypothetical protein OGAPHI_001235 [Ogataea philodendri]